jgi:hypothetical protein
VLPVAATVSLRSALLSGKLTGATAQLRDAASHAGRGAWGTEETKAVICGNVRVPTQQ